MAYFGVEHLKIALDELEAQGNAFLATVLAMLANKLPVGSSDADAVNFGNAQDIALLEKYFRPAGGEPTRPYYLPFGKDHKDDRWRDKKYPGRTLQRLRLDWLHDAFFHPNKKQYAFKPGFAKKMASRTNNFPLGKVSLAALTVWLKRQDDIASLEDAMATVVAELNLGTDNFDKDFLDQSVASYAGLPLRAEQLSDEEITEIIGGSAPPPAPAARDDIQARIFRRVSSRCRVDERLVHAIIGAWMAHDIVVLVGSPGTGKTMLANSIAAAMDEALDTKYVEVVPLQITSEHDVGRFLGYENLEGILTPSEFTRKLLLDKAARLQTCIVILDEWNLANIDEYFAPVLAAIESTNPISLPGRPPDAEEGAPEETEFTRSLPVDLFVIATCNSYREEPETRQKLSRPVKRRSTIFSVPNFLAIDAARSGTSKAVSDIANMMIGQETSAVNERVATRSATAFDTYRSERLGKFARYENIDADIRTKLETVIDLLLKLPSGRQYVTIGVLKDLVLNVLYARDGEQIDALGLQVCGKLLHLYEGPVSAIRPLADVFAGSSAHSGVQLALDEMSAAAEFAGGEAVSLL